MAYPEYYQIMGVEPTASPEEIKHAYIRLVKMYHPDTHQGNVAAEEKLKKINEAYDTLKDLAKRAEYDYYGDTKEELTDTEVVTGYPQPYEASADYVAQKNNEFPSSGVKKKYYLFKLFAFCLLLFYAFFMYTKRDLKYPQNVALMIRNSSQTAVDIGSTLIKNGAEKIRDSQSVKDAKSDLLFYAVKNNKFYLALSMLKISAPNLIDKQNHGRSLLMEATDAEIIELLISFGADVNYQDDEGETALTLAVRRGDAVAAELLLQAGANVNYVLPEGATALQIAVANNDTVMMKVLQGHGAKLSDF